MTTQQKAREFWIRQAEDFHDEDIIETGPFPQAIHVIERSAYQKAVDCIRSMTELREEACHDLGIKTLKELGEL